jgi:glycosyltransferase involved in cell wall biosynthesis
MDAPTSVAILIATYNWPQALQQTLMSVANQTIQPNEVLIADDGSDERTSKLIQAFKLNHPNLNIIHVWHEDNGFRLAAIRNKSIRMAQSDYIIQIDGDIILDQHFIADHLSIKEKGFFVTGSRLLLGKKITDALLESEKVNFARLRWKGKNFFNTLRIPMFTGLLQNTYKTKGKYLYYVKGCNMAFWKSDLYLVNGYDESFNGWGREDTDICIRLIHAGVKKKFIKFGGVQYHLHHALASRDQLDANDALIEQLKLNQISFCKQGLVKSEQKIEHSN